MKKLKPLAKLAVISFLYISSTQLALAVADSLVIEEMNHYVEFAEYSDGSITRTQLDTLNQKDLYYIDARNAGQYSKGHIPNAVNIEWREILSRRDEIPQDKTVILYCETGLLSAKAHLMLSIAGRTNVKVLWGGYLTWSVREQFKEAKKHK